MRTVFLVPRRADNGHRDKLWAWCRRRWETIFPDIPIIEGHHEEGPFNRSAAINRAARAAGEWDLAIVIDSDVFLRQSQVQAAIYLAAQTGKVTWAHRRWRGIREDWSKRIVADKRDLGPELERVEDMDVWVERTNPISWSCCFVVPRAVYDDAGGFDERFVGWGFEDLAWQSLVVGLYGFERIEGDVIHLWHPRSEERIILGESAATASQDYVTNGRLGRRYMYALRRDHNLSDRQEPMSDAERTRDLANLKRDDAKFARLQEPRDRARWEDWWPKLDELRDGSKEYIEANRLGTVTIIVHTGGAPENWTERRAYLERSLPSLVERVSGPIVQRVVYDCWGDAAIRAELEALARPLGFYVVGPTERPDFTGSMVAMWRYLGKRARGTFILQVEDDFTYERDVDLVPMMETLHANPHLVQIALLRDACYPDERETGGILGWPEPAFTRIEDNGASRLEHNLFWTNNPSLFRRSLTDRPWPRGHHSETLFGKALFRDPTVRSAFWGQGEEWIRHIGEVRAGVGY